MKLKALHPWMYVIFGSVAILINPESVIGTIYIGVAVIMFDARWLRGDYDCKEEE